MSVEERFEKIISYFVENQTEAKTELQFQTPFQLLVAVILSAQCTDKRVNLITQNLFSQFFDAESFAKATANQIFELIKSCSYPNNKAKYLVAMSKMLVEKFDGKIPDSLEKLRELPGVGQKTANVILSSLFNKPVMPVDTHVFRVSERLGLTTNSKSPLETEKMLTKYICEKYIAVAHHWLLLHGRYICVSRKPKCEVCGLKKFCRYFNATASNTTE